MNGLQTLDNWQSTFKHPTGSLLGIFNAIQSIGGIAGLPFAPYLADRLGRRATIFIGSSSKPNSALTTGPRMTANSPVLQSCSLV
jgi:MFS family permease